MHVIGLLSTWEIPFAEKSTLILACTFSAFELRLFSWFATFYLLVFLAFLVVVVVLALLLFLFLFFPCARLFIFLFRSNFSFLLFLLRVLLSFFCPCPYFFLNGLLVYPLFSLSPSLPVLNGPFPFSSSRAHLPVRRPSG